MNATTEVAAVSGISSRGAEQKSQFAVEIQSFDANDGMQFRAALERNMREQVPKISSDSHSLGTAIANRTTNLASEVKQDQLHVSKLLEQATRTGDSLQLMKAMMALNDFQLRVQTISKTVSKAASSVDSLTKLQ
ncbi:EscI/YscI/HrpB family type III secretion system inner rod protein [Herbaspirillum sp. RV1423]|uniref:EscI/YscI/HrpB family type III secretion system inner rod protein n=1 Tax=Herbaspirillum sp. RV1423 TaxID=1443993 RepID=UPI0004ADD905|nr:EscI/YscI/HrpB family type III secretion system inner rod protein [Herbaspirillum sp. RV1423]